MADKIDWTTIETVDLSSYANSSVVSSVARAKAIKFGKIVHLNISVQTVALAAGGTYTLFQGLPNNLRPSETETIPAVYQTKPTARANVGSNGVIQLTNWEASSNPSVNIAGTYFTS